MTSDQAIQLIQDVEQLLWFVGIGIALFSFYWGFKVGYTR